MIQNIQQNKQYLSDIDGEIGDGDHGINMNKGFTLAQMELEKNPGNLSHRFLVIARVLSMKIGGAMGPIYGKIFKAMGNSIAGKEYLTAIDVGRMLNSALDELGEISNATKGDKTLIDSLAPAAEEYNKSLEKGSTFPEALNKMKSAAIQGRDSTREMISRVGRSSRIGERSRGVIDAGAASCCIILCTLADTALELLGEDSVSVNN